MSSFQISKARLKQIIREEQTRLDEIARPIGAGYGDNEDAMEALSMAAKAIRKARMSNTPLAQDVSTDAYMMAKRVEENLTKLIDMIGGPAMQPGNRQENIEEARFSEYGKIDAEMGNPPSKIGQGDEEYMKAYNAVLIAKGEEPLPVVKPDQAYLDALRSGKLGKQEGKQKSTKKYDDNPKLKGDQDELPDSLQKAIIKKAGGDAEEEDEEKNESLDLEAMIRQEILAALNGA